jgi:type I restriction enzyme R subunit
VLRCFTPVESYYRIVQTVEDDPEFDPKKARKKLTRYVEGNEDAIRIKAETMIDHFHDKVIAARKIDGKARAMVVTAGIERAMQYKVAFDAYLARRKSPFKAIVAFSGDHEFQGEKGITESRMNGFASNLIPQKFREDPYRFLIVAEKFQTGFDEPLLHTMYVDKVLSDIKAVQTLSRLNRAHPDKHDVFILDFANDPGTIEAAFADYYKTTILSRDTDPNKLHDLKTALDRAQVYSEADVRRVVDLYVRGAGRDQLEPTLEACVAAYNASLDEDEQVTFKSNAKMFVRTYSFLATVLPYCLPEWEYLAAFLTFLTPKLPAPKETDLSRGILETVDMDSYRAEVKAQLAISLPDSDSTLDPVPVAGSGTRGEVTLDRLSNIVRIFNDLFGSIEWKDADKIGKVITEEIPGKVNADKAYQNARKQSDRQNARIEHDNALRRVMMAILADHTELYKQFSDNESFRQWLTDMVFDLTYEDSGG